MAEIGGDRTTRSPRSLIRGFCCVCGSQKHRRAAVRVVCIKGLGCGVGMTPTFYNNYYHAADFVLNAINVRFPVILTIIL